ncbi:MAG: T9SS type A sorting domain-containing protein [Flavobacteriales bacterium]|nr:T9SS type A sorting domain-containing protein [Flavobacteriales bacterium]
MNTLLKSTFIIALSLFVKTASVQCHFVPSTSTTLDTVNYTFNGSGFASYGCAPIDPTFWIYDGGIWATATFINPQFHPSIRVWGMNDDDVASVQVNGAAYPLNALSASYNEKVVCGLSPGPDGIVFNLEGNIVGANDNAEGNYSYQDITLHQENVTSITISGISGAGWGFAGVSVECILSTDSFSPTEFKLFPNPTSEFIFIQGDIPAGSELIILNELGTMIERRKWTSSAIDISNLPQGVYLISVGSANQWVRNRVVKI